MVLVAWFSTFLAFSILFTIGHSVLSYSIYSKGLGLGPLRVFLSIFIPYQMAKRAHRKGHLTVDGAVTAFIFGCIIVLTSYTYMATMLAFFWSSSFLTKKRKEKEKDLEPSDISGTTTTGSGPRDFRQVICNGGIPLFICLLSFMEAGGPVPINRFDFARNYYLSCLCLSYLGSLAFAAGDTWASELGPTSPALLSSRVVLITDWGRIVPPGTNGGITVKGLVSSCLGGLLIGITYLICAILHYGIPIIRSQFPILPFAAFMGAHGSIIDSFLGATFQYSGYDPLMKKVVNVPCAGVQRISGRDILSNNSVNLISAIICSLLSPYFGVYLFEKFL